MKIYNFIFLIVSLLALPHYSFGLNDITKVDTVRFELRLMGRDYQLIDKYLKKQIVLKRTFLINPEEEKRDEGHYVSSFNFLEKTNSFAIGNGLIGIQISSFSSMKEGSAQAAAGRDVFIIYNPKKVTVSDKKLEFGITKQRIRYMGCLSAKSIHFILADVDNNGLIDIGCIKEQLICEDFSATKPVSNPKLNMRGISLPYFRQDSVKWYVFDKSFWSFKTIKNEINDYIELPLIEIKLNPIDVFGFIRWHSYDPKDWNRITEVNYYPRYRLELLKKQLRKK